MTRSETLLTNLARKNGKANADQHVARVPTGDGWQFAITDAGERSVRCLLGKTFASAKADLLS